jgi:HSP20 family protein
LPADVDPDKVKADFKDDVLKIEIPKPEEKRLRQIPIH